MKKPPDNWGHAGLRPRIGGASLAAWPTTAAILAAGLTLGLAGMTLAATLYKNSLRTRVHSIAEAMDGSRITRQKLAPGNDAAKADTQYLKAKLAAIKSANADSRFLYLMARDTRGQVYFLADSEPVDSPAYSSRGEAYPEASAKLKSMFDNGRLLVEGPSHDSYGTWLSVLAPVYDQNGYGSSPTAVVGMDVPVSTYVLILALAGGMPLLFSIILASVFYIRHQVRTRHREQVQFRAEMISIASHELRTPLTGMRWSVESLLGGKLPADKHQRALEITYDSILRLEESIEDILQLANLESGRAQRLFIKQTDLRHIMDDILAMQRLAAERRNVSLRYTDAWPAELPVDCDAQRIKRVFHNLVSNAVKYSRPDTTINIGYRQTETGNHIITIQDQGIGIPAADQPRVWDGFYRAANANAQDIRGTGMGLYLSRTIIEQHGGRVWLESVEGQGTTLFVELPAVSRPEPAPAAGPAPAKP